MDNKIIGLIAAAAIAILILKPDLISSIFRKTQNAPETRGGGGGGGIIVVPPVVTQPSTVTNYDVDIGAPMFPENPITDTSDNIKSSYTPSHKKAEVYSGKSYSGTEVKEFLSKPVSELSPGQAKMQYGLSKILKV